MSSDKNEVPGANPSENLRPDVNPLDTVDPRSLDELMSMDPLKMSDQDVDEVIARYRKERHLWAKEDAEAKANKKSAPRAPKGTITDISLDDLGL